MTCHEAIVGEPAVPTAIERAATFELAMAIYGSVGTDQPAPLIDECPIDIDNLGDLRNISTAGQRQLLEWSRRVDRELFRLSQDLVDTRAALESACSTLEGNYTENERSDIADRLRKLDVTPLDGSDD